jgi:hypothetical protein
LFRACKNSAADLFAQAAVFYSAPVEAGLSA